jgi:hypothetical protein
MGEGRRLKIAMTGLCVWRRARRCRKADLSGFLFSSSFRGLIITCHLRPSVCIRSLYRKVCFLWRNVAIKICTSSAQLIYESPYEEQMAAIFGIAPELESSRLKTRFVQLPDLAVVWSCRLIPGTWRGGGRVFFPVRTFDFLWQMQAPFYFFVVVWLTGLH